MASSRLPVGPRTKLFSPHHPHTTMDMLEESLADNDEPPDELLMATPKASKPATAFERRPTRPSISHSLITQMIHTPESESQEEDENMFSDEITRRAHSSASTWSHGSFSTNDLHSDGCQSPAAPGASPTLKPAFLPGALPTFNFKSFNAPATPRTTSSESIGPLQVANAPKEQTFEAGVGRKRCIQFACGGRKDESKAQEPEKQEVKPAEPVKRACMLKFICPTRQEAAPAPVDAPKRTTALTFACPNKQSGDAAQTLKPRMMSPPPSSKSLSVSPRIASRAHRGSDATVRNDSSPKTVRKMPSALRHRRRTSVDTEIDRSEATRFHEFASSDEEIDDWTQEATCHRTRLTVSDTLKIENNLRKACTEAAEEDEEEDDVDNASAYDDDEDDEEADDDEDGSEAESTSYSSDDGFASDDEEGFACSDEESDGGSDFEWWAPGRRASMSEPLEHIRPTQRRVSSASSIESIENGQGIDIPDRKQQRRARSDRPETPELPDSTDFVCGTLDEDRPAEQAYLQHLEKLRLANRRPVPQDIDPSFPESDPEMDEEDEDSDHVVSESESHTFLHGSMDEHHESDSRARSPRRLRSPPLAKRVQHRSPAPPRRLFGQSPQRRCRSPPPATRLRSPPPSRRASVKQPKQIPNGLAFRPRLIRQTSSLPRSGIESARQSVHDFYNDDEDNDDDDEDQTGTLRPTRTAIDIVKGLEKKRQRRREKLYEKHCRNKSKRPEKTILPGRGCQRMRDVGIELNNYRGKKQQQQLGTLPPHETTVHHRGIVENKSGEIHILSV